MPVYYNSQKIIPAPFVQITKSYNRASDNTKLNTSFNLTITGTLVSFKGSPDGLGALWTGSGEPVDDTVTFADPNLRLKAILKKQEGLRELFSVDGKSFEIQPLDGSAPIKCYPIVKSIDFGQGTWFDLCQYTIQLDADLLYGTNGLLITEDSELTNLITDASESWDISFNEELNTFQVTHSISATGKLHYVDDVTSPLEPWQNAKTFVFSKTQGGSNPSTLASFLSSGTFVTTTGYSGYNYVLVNDYDKIGGRFSATESWVLSKENTFEEYVISVDNSAENPRKSVSIQGTIYGTFTNYTDTSVKYDRALAKFNSLNLYTRVGTITGLTLNAIPLSSSVGHNVIGGSVNYNYTYDDRPSNIMGGDVIFERIEVSEDYPGEVFVSIPVIGRSYGPILQRMNTYSERIRTLNIELRLQGTQTYASKPNPQTIIDLVQPTLTSKLFKSGDSDSWDWKNGNYTRTIRWVYENA